MSSHRNPRKKKRAAEVSLIVSVVFHGLIIGGLVFLAAREGYLGKQLKTIAVTMVPKEKPPEPEKPKAPEKPVEPPSESPKPVEIPPVVAATRPATAAPAAPSPVAAPASSAPPPASLPAFNFSDGAKSVQSSSDPLLLYKNFVEFSLRSKWLRPEGLDDKALVAEVEVSINSTGQVLGSTWKHSSGNGGWDESVKRALALTTSLSRPPPKGFPAQFLVRFDVVEEADASGLVVP